MMRHLPAVLLPLLLCSVVEAQRDAPVWECYLPKISISHAADAHLNLDLSFRKEGGPYEHDEHQMYIIVYAAHDEEAIVEMAQDRALLDKKSEDKQIIDVLLEKKLIAIVETKVAKRTRRAAQDNLGNYQWGSSEDNGGTGIELNTYRFEFSFPHQALFDAASKLESFDSTGVKYQEDSPYTNYEDKIKLLAFVPVNDSKYSTEVREELQSTHDFARWQDAYSNDYRRTPLLYFKPLPYRFQFSRHENDPLRILID